MDLDAILWSIAYLILFVKSNILWFGIRSYLLVQPPGETSLYLSIFRDMTVIIQISTSLHCILIGFTRFDCILDILYSNRAVFMVICTMVECAHLTAILQSGCFCLVRFLCFRNIELMEVRLGEKIVRQGALAFSLTCQVGIILAYTVFTSDSLNGSTAIVVTQVPALPGNNLYCDKLTIIQDHYKKIDIFQDS